MPETEGKQDAGQSTHLPLACPRIHECVDTHGELHCTQLKGKSERRPATGTASLTQRYRVEVTGWMNCGPASTYEDNEKFVKRR